MVFESLINPLNAEKRPWMMLFVGMVYSSVAVFLSLFIFGEYASLVMIFLTVLACVPLMHSTIKLEEEKDLAITDKRRLFKEHTKALSFFIFLFIGFVISYALWYVVLPEHATDVLFNTQHDEINRVENMAVTGNAITLTSVFGKIFFNNLTVMAFSVVFAFFYGVGAIFILTWNASLIGTAVGRFAESAGSSYFHSFPAGLFRYLIHGVPEMFAYFMAGLAGGIISIAIIRHDFGEGKFKHISIDSLDLVFMSVVILFCAALIEVFITPLFFM